VCASSQPQLASHLTSGGCADVCEVGAVGSDCIVVWVRLGLGFTAIITLFLLIEGDWIVVFFYVSVFVRLPAVVFQPVSQQVIGVTGHGPLDQLGRTDLANSPTG